MMMNNTALGTLLFLFLFSSNDSARILVNFLIPSKSHSILGHGVVDRLLEAGHEVVHITAFPKSKPVQNLREINIGHVREKLLKDNPDQIEKFKLKNLMKSDTSSSLSFLLMPYVLQKMILEVTEVQELLSNPNEKFDAVVQEWFFHDAIAGIGPLLNAPFIWVVSTELHWQPLRIIDEIQNPSYMVDIFSASQHPLSFLDRAQELWRLIKRGLFVEVVLSTLEKYTVYNTIFQELAIKRGVTLPSYSEAIYNGTFMLINSHPSIGKPYRLPQNAKYVAGYHIADKVAPLPTDLKKLMDDAKNGVIYFSMGSTLKSEDMTTEMKESLLNMFGKLKQTIIWKYEDNLKNVPSNVFLMKWAPQPGILSHPNLKFFITHGGQLSTTEAIHYGVPVIGVPVMADQFINMNAIVNKGYGIKVQIDDDIADKLNLAIQEMLNNPSYAEKAKKISATYHDRPVTPGKEMVFWIEHVIRTGGAPHLRSPAIALSWYQKLYLDFAAVIIVIVTIVYRFLKKIYSMVRRQKKPVSQNKKMKKNL